MASANRFGFEWEKYSKIDPVYEQQFKNWVSPLSFNDFKNKSVLDAGCGMGRNSYWSLKWGAKELIAFDYDSRTVEAAKNTLASFKNAQVFLKSIYEIDWREKFDLVFSVGVIHHLSDPKLALKNLVKALKPGGKLVVWVYSHEGNEWVVYFVNPVRKFITSKLPLPILHFLTYFVSAPLWVFVKLFRGPSDYLRQLSGFKFWHIHSIVFDQLLPSVANYWKKAEVEELFSGLGLKEIDMHIPPNKCGWTIIAKK